MQEAIKDRDTGEILTVGALEKGLRKTGTAADTLKLRQAEKEVALAKKATAQARQAREEYLVKGLEGELKRLGTLIQPTPTW